MTVYWHVIQKGFNMWFLLIKGFTNGASFQYMSPKYSKNMVYAFLF
mgnify:CR=1 FL=1